VATLNNVEGGLLPDAKSEVNRLSADAVGGRATVQSVVCGVRRTHEVDSEFRESSVGDVQVPVKQHRRRRTTHAVVVLRQNDLGRSLDEHSTSHARRTSGPCKHLHQSRH